MSVRISDINLRNVIIGPGGSPPPPPPITITAFTFTAYSIDPSGFTIQQLPFYAGAYPGIPYTWVPSTDIQFVLQPAEILTIQLTMSGYTGAVTGTNLTVASEYEITAIGQIGNLYTFTITNIIGGATTIPEDLIFTVTDSINAVGTYHITAVDIFT